MNANLNVIRQAELMISYHHYRLRIRIKIDATEALQVEAEIAFEDQLS